MTEWLEVKAEFDAAPEDWARVHIVFEANGIDGTVQTDSPPTMSGYWVVGTSAGSPQKLIDDLQLLGAKVTTTTIEEEAWSESWKQYFQPRTIGKRLFLCPSWDIQEPPQGCARIVLDPGQAFGTGDHPTTRMCLELLCREVVEGMKIADIGCGSGILSIAALLLGAVEAWAVDVDPISVRSALENAVRNGVLVQAFEGKGFDPIPAAAKFDLVFSNIISAALIGLAPEVPSHVKVGGKWAVSGVIEGNWPDVLKAAQRAGFRLETKLLEGDWVAAMFQLN